MKAGLVRNLLKSFLKKQNNPEKLKPPQFRTVGVALQSNEEVREHLMTDKQGVLEWYIGTSPPLGGLSWFLFF